MKLWDLTTQHCIQTIIAHQSEIWSVDVDPAGELLFTGTSDGEMKAWSIDVDALTEGLQESAAGEVGLTCFACQWGSLNSDHHFYQLTKMIRPVGILPLSQKQRVSQISFHPTEPYLAVQSHDRSVEVFSIRTEDEIKKKRARKRQRAREKAKKKGQDGDVMAVDEPDEAEESVALDELFSSYIFVRANGKIRSFDFINAEVNPRSGMQVG